MPIKKIKMAKSNNSSGHPKKSKIKNELDFEELVFGPRPKNQPWAKRRIVFLKHIPLRQLPLGQRFSFHCCLGPNDKEDREYFFEKGESVEAFDNLPDRIDVFGGGDDTFKCFLLERIHSEKSDAFVWIGSDCQVYPKFKKDSDENIEIKWWARLKENDRQTLANNFEMDWFDLETEHILFAYNQEHLSVELLEVDPSDFLRAFTQEESYS